jgi:hypothetical protein
MKRIFDDRRSPMAAACAVAFLFSLSLGARSDAQTLEKFAALPADTFAPGPTSGQFITPANGRIPPFVGQQPVQGVSSVLRLHGGDFLVMSDNGFGAKDNSADYVLRVYRIDPDFRTKDGGRGTIAGEGLFGLPRPLPQGQLHDRGRQDDLSQRNGHRARRCADSPEEALDGERLRHRVVPAGAGRHVLVR